MKTKLLHSYGKHDIAEYDWDKPDPTDDQIEVKAQLTGICRSDIAMVQGNFGPLPFGMFGHEGLGQVTKVGKNVTDVVKHEYVATRSDAAYAYYYNAGPGEYVVVPECRPEYILEPIACAINIASRIEASELKKIDKILILGSGFLATVVHSHLKSCGKEITVVGNANKNYWAKYNGIKVKLFDNINKVPDKFKLIIDLSGKPAYFEHEIIDTNAHVIQAAEKDPPIQTNFSTYLWKNVTLSFPSPRDENFDICMVFAKHMVESGTFDPSELWTQAYSRNDFETAFDHGIWRRPGYSRGYIDWRL